MEIINPFIHISPCWCPKCESESIMLVNSFDRPIDYPSIIKNNDMKELNRLLNVMMISYMRCQKCGTKYMIDWTDTLPKPLYNLAPALTIM